MTTSSGSKYSSGSSGDSKPSETTKSKVSFWGGAEKSQAKQDSKVKFDSYKAKQQQPEQTYNYLKSQPKTVYATRPAREQTVFKTYYVSNPRPVVVYRDTSWNPYFWLWLMDRPDRQAEWVYHHRDQLSEERYQDLVAKNKDLAAQVKALEDKKLPKDPNYAPTEIDKDLMYSDDYVKKVQDDGNDYAWFLWLITPLGIGFVFWASWAVFLKKRKF